MKKTKRRLNRLLAAIFAITMVITSMPQIGITAQAALSGGVADGVVLDSDAKESPDGQITDVGDVGGTNDAVEVYGFSENGDTVGNEDTSDKVTFTFNVAQEITVCDEDGNKISSTDEYGNQILTVDKIGEKSTFRVRFIADSDYVLSSGTSIISNSGEKKRPRVKRVSGDYHDAVYEISLWNAEAGYASGGYTVGKKAMPVSENSLTFTNKMSGATVTAKIQKYDKENKNYYFEEIEFDQDNKVKISNEYDVYMSIAYPEGSVIDHVERLHAYDLDGKTYKVTDEVLICEETDSSNSRTYCFRVTEENTICDIYGGEACTLTWKLSEFMDVARLFRFEDESEGSVWYERDDYSELDFSKPMQLVKGEDWYFGVSLPDELITGEWYLTTTGDKTGKIAGSWDEDNGCYLFRITPDKDMTITGFVPRKTVNLSCPDNVTVSEITTTPGNTEGWETIIAEDKKSISFYEEDKAQITVKFPSELDFKPYYTVRSEEGYYKEEAAILDKTGADGVTTLSFTVYLDWSLVDIGFESDVAPIYKTLTIDAPRTTLYKLDSESGESAVLTSYTQKLTKGSIFHFRVRAIKGYRVSKVSYVTADAAKEGVLSANEDGYYSAYMFDDMTIKVETERLCEIKFILDNAEGYYYTRENEDEDGMDIGGDFGRTEVTAYVRNGRGIVFSAYPLTGYRLKYVSTNGTETGKIEANEEGEYVIDPVDGMTIYVLTEEIPLSEMKKIEVTYKGLQSFDLMINSGKYRNPISSEYLPDGSRKVLYAVPISSKDTGMQIDMSASWDTNFNTPQLKINDKLISSEEISNSGYMGASSFSYHYTLDEAEMANDVTKVEILAESDKEVEYTFETDEHVKVYAVDDDTNQTPITKLTARYGSMDALQIKVVADENYIVNSVKCGESNVSIKRKSGDSHSLIYEIAPRTYKEGHIQNVTVNAFSMVVKSDNQLTFRLNMTGATITPRIEKYDAEKGYYLESVTMDDTNTITVSNEYRVFFDIDYTEGNVIDRVEYMLSEEDTNSCPLSHEEPDPEYPNRRTYDYGRVYGDKEICLIYGGESCNVQFEVPEYIKLRHMYAIETTNPEGDKTCIYEEDFNEVADAVKLAKNQPWYFTVENTEFDSVLNVSIQNSGMESELQKLEVNDMPAIYCITPKGDRNVVIEAVRHTVPITATKGNFTVSKVEFTYQDEVDEALRARYNSDDCQLEYYPHVGGSASITVSFPAALEYKPYAVIYGKDEKDNLVERKIELLPSSYVLDNATGYVTAVIHLWADEMQGDGVYFDSSLKEIIWETEAEVVIEETTVHFDVPENAFVYLASETNSEGELLKGSTAAIKGDLVRFRVEAAEGYEVKSVVETKKAIDDSSAAEKVQLQADAAGWYSTQAIKDMTISIEVEKTGGSGDNEDDPNKPGSESGAAKITFEIPEGASVYLSSEGNKDGELLKGKEAVIKGNAVRFRVEAAQGYGVSRVTVTRVVKAADGKESTETVELTADGSGWYSATVSEGAKIAIYTERQSASGEVMDDSGLVISIPDGNKYTYTGSQIQPRVLVKNNNITLTEGVDYTVKYSNNVKAGEAKITVTGKGSFSGKEDIPFTIGQKSLQDAGIMAKSITIATNSKAVPVVLHNGVRLGAKDYTLSKTDAFGADGELTITGQGNYTGSITIKVKVVALGELSKFKVVMKRDKFVYDGSEHKLGFDITDSKSKKPLNEADYAVIYSADVTNAGTVKVTFIGQGNYTGTVTKSYKISPRKDNGMTLEYDKNKAYAFDSAGATVENLKVKNSAGVILTAGRDYKVSYSANKKAGKGKINVVFLGNYKGSKAVKGDFTIGAAVLDENTINVYVPDKVYTGKKNAYKSVPIVTDKEGNVLKKSDYTVKYYKNAACGEADEIKGKNNLIELTEENSATVYVKVTGKGNYAGNAQAFAVGKYQVKKLSDNVFDLSKAKVTFKQNGTTVKKLEYTGRPLKPEMEVVVTVKGKGSITLTPGQYNVQWTNNVNKGKATVIITGNGEAVNGTAFVGSKNASITIAAGKMKNKK